LAKASLFAAFLESQNQKIGNKQVGDSDLAPTKISKNSLAQWRVFWYRDRCRSLGRNGWDFGLRFPTAVARNFLSSFSVREKTGTSEQWGYLFSWLQLSDPDCQATGF